MANHDLIHLYLQRSAALNPEQTALIHGDERVSYRELERRAAAIGAWLLHKGMQAGDRVALLTDHPGEYIAAYFGIIATGHL